MPAINISQHEIGVVRVFAISRPMADMARALRQADKSTIASGLLRHEVTADDVELFALSDLTGLGLRQYLMDGYAVPSQAVQADHARLDALDGYVMLLLSRVSAEGPVALSPSPELTLIGTYREPRADHIAVPIAAQAAKPYSGVGTETQPTRRLRAGSAVTGLLALLTLLLIWWITR
ncbi:hypothetical protein [Parasphingorhabdus sp.]|uniref:hypothetical protein n=1 Tax=Parasphingorhabdus sp. TaxID=2709688 RepID=UPI0032972E5E